MPTPPPAVVIFVANVARVSEFYRHVADMRVEHADADHVVLDGAGLQLVIHALRGEPESVATPVAVREDSYIKPCLPVRSLAEARVAADRLGGHLRPMSDEWRARGFRACDGHDPEGNVFQARELA